MRDEVRGGNNGAKGRGNEAVGSTDTTPVRECPRLLTAGFSRDR